ncbi:hypothetical protein M8C21_025277 [Ambrosia artemisiifolia]|uniref:Methyltransferase type 11 domain-containing protein n=1 Tax=Ambrosia artemisiifolia TaxID=4212 RepID=A0AAD5CSD8_AMBAR|nr:hypothetical protein M8C21_025277 [Ambrosia artemisiifolia]
MYNFSISSYNSSLQHQQQNNPPNKTKQNKIQTTIVLTTTTTPTTNQPTNHHNNMFTDESACNTYNYGDSVYWDARYIHEASAGSFDWYQRYHALRPFVTKYVPVSSRILMVGCGNAVMSEDMVKDGYEDIMNVDISCVAIEMMRRKYEHMDVRDMGFFLDDSFDSVIDKARPGFQKPPGSTSSPKSHLSPVPTTEKGMLPADYVLEDPDSHYIYVCTKMSENPDPKCQMLCLLCCGMTELATEA